MSPGEQVSMHRHWNIIAAGLGLALLPAVAWAEHPAAASYRQGEARRQGLIAQQLDLNYRMNWPRGMVASWADPFEPWPFVPGDIWGYPSPPPVEHPVGYRSEQVARDRWIYRPVYADQVAAPRSLIVPRSIEDAPPAAIVPPRPSELDEPNAQPPAENAAKKKKPSGPRAF